MAEAVRVSPLRASEKYKDIDSLPVVTDPLPMTSKQECTKDESTIPAEVISPLPLVSEHECVTLSEERKKEVEAGHSCNDIVRSDESCVKEPSGEICDSKDEKNIHDIEKRVPYGTLSDTLVDTIYMESKPCEGVSSSAPPLMISSVLKEIQHEYTLPQCYSIDELKNFYSNPSADMIPMLEHQFLEEVSYDGISKGSSNENKDLLLEPFVVGSESSNDHPLLRLVSIYAQNRLIWKSTKDTLDHKLRGLSDVEKTIWKVEKCYDILKGICRDGCEVSLKYEYETAELDNNQLSLLDSSLKELRNYLFDQLSMASFKVAISRLEIESYLAQVLRQCPAFENFSSGEPIILLPERTLDPTLEPQIKRLRDVTSVLFTCLCHLTFTDVPDIGRVPQIELVDDLIRWIMCITGRLVRQCRLKDHVFVMMQLLRVPFNVITYTPSAVGSSLCALMQPPALDIAWFRVGGRSLDFLSEPEVEARGTLFALCLRTPKKGFQMCLHHVGESSLKTPGVLQTSGTHSKDGRQKWTIVDSDGESDVECSTNSPTTEGQSKLTSSSLRFEVRQDFVDVEGVSALFDQVDMPGLVDFFFSHCTDVKAKSNFAVLFAFANWLVTTLEQAVDILQIPGVDFPRFQRKIVKQIAVIISTLLSGLRSLIERAIASTSSDPLPLPNLYPDLHGHELANVKVILAQYDELCLRVMDFLLSKAAAVTTRLTCWRRFVRMSPLHIFSSRAKLQFYLLLVSAVSPDAGDVEGDFCETRFLARNEDMQALDETVTKEEEMEGIEVVGLLRAALIDQGCLAIPIITVLGQLASEECRPPILTGDHESSRLWLPSDIPVMERLLVKRILDILFRLCVVPTFGSEDEKRATSKSPILDEIPISTVCGRTQIMKIVSAHPSFAFQHLLDLIITSAVHLDSKTAVATNVPQRPDLSSSNVSAELLLDLIDALPPTLFTPNADELDKLFSWIGGHPTGELLPLNSIRSRISQKLLSAFPWEAVNNTTGECLISTQVQAWAAIAVAIAFQRHIVELHRQPAVRLSEAFNYYYAKSVFRVKSSPHHSRRTSSLSPPRIPSSTATRPPVPFASESASFYHWTMGFIRRLQLEPSTEALSRLLNATEQLENPLTTFLIVEFQLRRQPRPSLPTDCDACQVLLHLATSGHFALAIEAFSRLSLFHEANEKRQKKGKIGSSAPCEAFKKFVHCMLMCDESEYVNESFVSYLWSAGWWWHKDAKDERPRKRMVPVGPVLEAFLGAIMNASIGCAGEEEEEEKHSLLQAVILSTLSLVLRDGGYLQSQAIWFLENLLKTAFWVERSYPDSKQPPSASWWHHPIVDAFRPSALKKIVGERSDLSSKALEDESTTTKAFGDLFSQNYRTMASSWAEGLSTLIPTDGLQFHLPFFRSAAALTDSIDEWEGSVRLAVLQNLFQRASEDDEGSFWLIAYFIGGECDRGEDETFREYSLWDDVVDAITWNRSIILAASSSARSCFGDVNAAADVGDGDGEKCITSVLVEAGLLSSTSDGEQLRRLTRHLPLMQAVSALVLCPLHHPVFFLLLHLAITHCFAFSRTAGDSSNSNNNSSSGECVRCFPPGFVLLRALRWERHTLSANYTTSIRSSTMLDAFLCRLREALRYWLKRDSQDDVVDPYGLCSGNAVSLLRMTTGLLSDLDQAVVYFTTQPGALNVSTMLERIHFLDVNSALRSVSLDSIASTIYAAIDRWHFLRAPHKSMVKGVGAEPREDLMGRRISKYSNRRLDLPNLQQCRFDEMSMHGPLKLPPNRWYALVQYCVESLKKAASIAMERDREVLNLHTKLLEDLLPRLYKSITCHQSEVVECKSFLHLPFISSRVCKGGARITASHKTTQLDATVEAESTEVKRRIVSLVEEEEGAWNAALNAATTFSSHQSVTTSALSPLVLHVEEERGETVMCGSSSSWIISSFRLVSLLQRICRRDEMTGGGHVHDYMEQLVNILHLLCQSTCEAVYAFPPTKAVLSQCVDIIGTNLLSSDDCAYEVVLEALTGGSHQLLHLFSKLWPHLLESSLQAKAGSGLKHHLLLLLPIYRRLPLIIHQCGAKVAYDLLTKLPPLSEGGGGRADNAASRQGLEQVGGAEHLDDLIFEAFCCLHAVNETPLCEDTSKHLIELIRGQVTSYLQLNFPNTVIRLLEKASTIQVASTQEELWSLANLAICNNFSIHSVYPLSTDDVRHLLEKVDACARLAYDSRDLSVITKLHIVECLGVLNQQLGAKLSRCVELHHLSLQRAHNMVMESVMSTFWSRVVDVSASTSDDEVIQCGVKKLVDIIAALYECKETSESPLLFNAFLDALVIHVFSKPVNHTEVHLFDQVNKAFAVHTQCHASLPENFPWTLWQPSTSALTSLIQFISMPPSPPEVVHGSALTVLSYMLSHVSCWDNAPTEVHLAERADNLIYLAISLVCWYDVIEDKEDLISCSENLRRFIKSCQIFLLKYPNHSQLSSANVKMIKSHLRPATIINTSDLVFGDFFRLLSIASHFVGSRIEATVDPSPPFIYAPDPEIVSRQRRTFVSLSVDLLIAVECVDANVLHPVSAVTKAEEDAEPSTNHPPSRVYSLLMTSVLPVASSAIGAVVNSVTSSHLWKQIFVGTREDGDADVSRAFDKLIECKSPVRGFAWRICSLLSDLESCCWPNCWDAVESKGFKETVSYCEEVLRLRSRSGWLSAIVDATFIYWMGEGNSIDDSNASIVSVDEIGQVWTRTLCRPLLLALLYHLSSVSTYCSEQSAQSHSSSTSPSMAVISLIDKCLCILLQTNLSKCNLPTIPTDFETRLMRIGEVFEEANFNVHSTQVDCKLGSSGSWLVPTCLSCKKLLPLFIHAYSRWMRIATTAASRKDSKPSTSSTSSKTVCLVRVSDSSVILLADILHWFAVLDLSPSDVCADSCAASPQLTALLLLLHLSLKLILSVEGGRGDVKTHHSSSQDATQIRAFLHFLQGLNTKWKKVVTQPSYISQSEADFVAKFCEMTNCLIGLVEEWEVSQQGESKGAVHGLTRLESGRDEQTTIGKGNRSVADIAHAAVCALMAHLHDQVVDTESSHSPPGYPIGENLLTAFAFLCQRIWSPLPNFVDYLLCSSSSPLCIAYDDIK